jgi:hypothetical protein
MQLVQLKDALQSPGPLIFAVRPHKKRK